MSEIKHIVWGTTVTVSVFMIAATISEIVSKINQNRNNYLNSKISWKLLQKDIETVKTELKSKFQIDPVTSSATLNILLDSTKFPLEINQHIETLCKKYGCDELQIRELLLRSLRN